MHALKKQPGLEECDNWEDARDELDRTLLELQDEIDAIEEAIEYATNQTDAPAPPKDEPTTGWRCSGCQTGTLSRCLTCDEPACGNCLLVHECAAVLV